MTLSINLTPDAEARLRRQAAAAGKDIAAFVQEAIDEKLAAVPASHSSSANGRVVDRLAKFNRWIASHKPRTHLADDSRDAIYGDERD